MQLTMRLMYLYVCIIMLGNSEKGYNYRKQLKFSINSGKSLFMQNVLKLAQLEVAWKLRLFTMCGF